VSPLPAHPPPAAPRRLRLAAACVLAAAAVAPAAPRAADPLPARLTLEAGRAAVAVELAPAIPRELDDRLGNGLKNVVSVVVGVVPAGGEPAAAAARVVEVLYDVWESRWEVTVRDVRSPAGRREAVADAAALHALLGRAADVELGPAAALPAGGFTLEIQIVLNPVSPELLARTREHLADTARPGGGARSVLGAVAGFLLREPDEAAESLSFRTVPLAAPGVRP
jgi:hypothetical protein